MHNIGTVTVAVITYNSSKYVIETLDSIKNQSYEFLSLIISDDCSTDNTVEICERWIEENQTRFQDVQLLKSEQNTGVSANVNRAWNACNTKYLKDIAGDDLLLPNCIADYVEYIKDNPTAYVVFAKIIPFEVINKKKRIKEEFHNYDFFKLTPEEQLHYLFYVGNRLPAASVFYNIDAMRKFGIANDERIPLLEDYPKWITLLRKGIKLFFLDKKTVEYRTRPGALSTGLFHPSFYKSNLLFYLYYFLDEIKDDSQRDSVYNLICEHESRFYKYAYDKATSIFNSKSFILYYKLTAPARWIKQLFHR